MVRAGLPDPRPGLEHGIISIVSPTLQKRLPVPWTRWALRVTLHGSLLGAWSCPSAELEAGRKLTALVTWPRPGRHLPLK